MNWANILLLVVLCISFGELRSAHEESPFLFSQEMARDSKKASKRFAKKRKKRKNRRNRKRKSKKKGLFKTYTIRLPGDPYEHSNLLKQKKKEESRLRKRIKKLRKKRAKKIALKKLRYRLKAVREHIRSLNCYQGDGHYYFPGPVLMKGNYTYVFSGASFTSSNNPEPDIPSIPRWYQLRYPLNFFDSIGEQNILERFFSAVGVDNCIESANNLADMLRGNITLSSDISSFLQAITDNARQLFQGIEVRNRGTLVKYLAENSSSDTYPCQNFDYIRNNALEINRRVRDALVRHGYQ